MVAMQPVAGTVPVHAEIGLTGTEWGTEVTMRCGYDASAGYGKAYTFRLVAHGPSGATEQIGSWLRRPPATTCGSPARPGSPTRSWSAWSSSEADGTRRSCDRTTVRVSRAQAARGAGAGAAGRRRGGGGSCGGRRR